jgi:hypothetical protein
MATWNDGKEIFVCLLEMIYSLFFFHFSPDLTLLIMFLYTCTAVQIL